MNKSRIAALIAAACMMIISLISLPIKEACYSQVQASSFLVDNKQKVVLILADYIELQDFAENKYLEQLFNSSYSALISGRQNGKASSVKAKLTLGSGKRLEVTTGLKSAYNYPNNGDTSVHYFDINSLKHQNNNSDYSEHIGYLGNTLHQYGKKTCVIGNSDTDIIDRSAVMISMDEDGFVDNGDVENTLMIDNSYPGGMRTDFDKVFDLYQFYYGRSDLIIIDTGDLARLEDHKIQISPETYKGYRTETLEKIAQFTRRVIENGNERTTFMILSSYPSKRSLKSGFKLTTMLVHDKTGSGVLYSSSTKREGVVTSLDIPDFLIGMIIGRDNNVISKNVKTYPMKDMLLLARRLLNTSGMRLPVLTWYAIFEIACATVGLIYILIINKGKLIYTSFYKILMLANIIAPAVLLYMAVLVLHSAMLYFFIFVLTSFAIAAALALVIKNSTLQFLGASFFVNFSIIVDLLRDSVLIKNSVFGYDPIIGARFYGIGNEFAGVFIGSGILLAGCMLQYWKAYIEKRPKVTALLVGIYTFIQLFMMGTPITGANFGGTIAGVVGYFFFYCSVIKSKIKFRHLIILGFTLVIALTSIILWDLSVPNNTTHVGKFITDIKDNGIKVLYATMARKIEMNIKLIKYTIWTKVLLCIILILTIMFFKPVRLMHSIFKKYSYFTAAWLGISAGSIAGLIANDSGIVMAATAMIFTGYTILYICMEERAASN